MKTNLINRENRQSKFDSIHSFLSNCIWKKEYLRPLKAVLIIVLLIPKNDLLANNGISKDSLVIRNGNFSENVEWHDNRGELINAHDGGIIEVNGTYYWYGLALRPMGIATGENSGEATSTGITLYSSKNLHSWKYEGIVLAVSSDPKSELRSPMRFERPKIIYNKKTKKYVLWFHYVGYPGHHGQNIGEADAGVAISDKITGPFKYLGHHRPIDDNGAVKDLTVFVDEDAAAYLIYDRKTIDGTRSLHIVKLTDDYLHTTNQWAKIDNTNRREAPAVIKQNGVYYLVTSDVSGWNANAAKVYKAHAIMGPWTEVGNPCTGEGIESTYNSQSTFAFKVKGKPNLAIMMLERHNTENFMRCSYIWLPITFTPSEELLFPYKKEWNISSFSTTKK